MNWHIDDEDVEEEDVNKVEKRIVGVLRMQLGDDWLLEYWKEDSMSHGILKDVLVSHNSNTSNNAQIQK